MTTWLRKLAMLLPWVRREREQILEEEFRSYLEMAREEAERAGLRGAEAVSAARRDFGNMLRAKEDVRSEWVPRRLEEIARDIRFTVRSLKRTPLFAVIAILSLALGIGSATAVFSLVDGILLKPLAYREPEQLVYVQEVVPALSHVYPKMPVNLNHFLYWHDHVRAFKGLCALRSSGYTLTGSGQPEQLDAVDTSADLFQVLETRMAKGRGFLPGEDEPGKNNVAVITDSLWRSSFHAADEIVGASILLDGKPVTVVGVLPGDFTFPKAGEMGSLAGLPKRTELFRPIQHRIKYWNGDFDFIVIGRLKTGISMTQGISELEVLNGQMAKAHGVDSRPRPAAQPLRDVIGGSVRTALLVLLAAVLVLLLIVCVNVANLTMARASGRMREFSIRTSLGAGRRRLLQQMLTEAFVLSAAGGALGMVLSAAAIQLFVARAAVEIPRIDEVHINGAVLLFSLALTLLCVCSFGLFPAYRVSRCDLHGAMKTGGRTITANKQSLRLREILVGVQVALSTVLVFLAGLLISSLLHLLNTDKGFHEERAVAVDFGLPDTTYPDAAARNRFLERALSEIRAIPAVQSGAMISGLPLTGETQVNSISLVGSDADWIDPANRTEMLINVRFISESYFEALGIPMLDGRPLEERDRDRRVTVISKRFAAKVWPGQNPLGKKFKTGSQVGEVEVVGVASDTYNGRLDGQPTLIAYVPYRLRSPSYGSLVVRSSMDPAPLMRSVQRVIWSIDSNLPVTKVRTMSELVDQALARRKFQMQIATAFGLGALMLALIGIYGVVAYNVEQRRGELGLRLALGAKSSELIGLMLTRGLPPVSVGLTCGLLLSIALGGTIRGLVYGISTSDPWTTVSVAGILGLTAFAACLLPASRAAGMDPASILRHE